MSPAIYPLAPAIHEVREGAPVLRGAARMWSRHYRRIMLVRSSVNDTYSLPSNVTITLRDRTVPMGTSERSEGVRFRKECEAEARRLDAISMRTLRKELLEGFKPYEQP